MSPDDELLQAARADLDALRLEEAAGRVRKVLAAHPTGGAGEARLPALTLLGEVLLESARAEEAVAPLEEALVLAGPIGGEPLLKALERRWEVARWLGDGRGAARLLAEMAAAAEEAGDRSDADRWQRRAARFPDGEPLLRVVVRQGQKVVELDELAELEADPEDEEESVEGAQFLFERNRPVLRLSEAGVDAGEELAEAGRFADALAAFDAAGGHDRFDPHPRYLAALALAYVGRFAEAVARYDEVERLAPGWFQVRADRALCQLVVEGAIDPEAWRALGALEGGGLAPDDKLGLARQLIRELPRLGQPHLAEGRSLLALGDPDEAERAFRRGIRVADEPDVRSRLLFELGSLVENDEERVRALEEAQLLPGNLVAAAMARFVLTARGAG